MGRRRKVSRRSEKCKVEAMPHRMLAGMTKKTTSVATEAPPPGLPSRDFAQINSLFIRSYPLSRHIIIEYFADCSSICTTTDCRMSMNVIILKQLIHRRQSWFAINSHSTSFYVLMCKFHAKRFCWYISQSWAASINLLELIRTRIGSSCSNFAFSLHPI